MVGLVGSSIVRTSMYAGRSNRCLRDLLIAERAGTCVGRAIPIFSSSRIGMTSM
jgi:hypothetical protein